MQQLVTEQRPWKCP